VLQCKNAKHLSELNSLLTLNFQTFENVQIIEV
jgi:hypothetical protein